MLPEKAHYRTIFDNHLLSYFAVAYAFMSIFWMRGKNIFRKFMYFFAVPSPSQTNKNKKITSIVNNEIKLLGYAKRILYLDYTNYILSFT